jgi:hypothetical protein
MRGPVDPTVEDLEELEGAFAPLYFGEPISDDEPELGSERVRPSCTLYFDFVDSSCGG